MSVTEDELLEILEDNRKELKKYAKLLRRLSKEYNRVCAELATTNSKIESLSASPPEPTESEECSSCLAVMVDLAELRHRYAQRVEERDAMLANLEATKNDLLAA